MLLVELTAGDWEISLLLNCGGFPGLFASEELSPTSGLVTDLGRTRAIRDALRASSAPGDHGTRAEVWAIWRALRDGE